MVRIFISILFIFSASSSFAKDAVSCGSLSRSLAEAREDFSQVSFASEHSDVLCAKEKDVIACKDSLTQELFSATMTLSEARASYAAAGCEVP